MADWKFRTAYNLGSDARDLLIRCGGAVVEPLVLTKRLRVESVQPTLSATLEATQDGLPDVEGFLRAALNCAWELGLRPDGFNDTRESMKATNAHLQDMRALAFHKIGAKAPTNG